MDRGFNLANLVAASIFWAAAAGAAAPMGYAIKGAVQSRVSYPYLTVTTVSEKLQPMVAAQVPPLANGRLVFLMVTFQASGDPNAMVELDPTDLQVQWTVGGARGSAPVLGAHLSKDFIVMGSGEGFFTSMRPDQYELFAIVPKSARMLDLALRQADGSFKVVKAKILLSPAN